MGETTKFSLDDDSALAAAYDNLDGLPDPCGNFSTAVYCGICVGREHARVAPLMVLEERVKAIEDIIESLQAEAEVAEIAASKTNAVLAVFGPSHPSAKSAGSNGTKSSAWDSSQLSIK